MLHEAPNVRQVPKEGRRRWFTDPTADLIVWYDKAGNIDGFQLCYDKGVHERALTWRRGFGYCHEKVDDGESEFWGMKMTPILVPDGAFNSADIAARFRRESAEIDPDIAKLVLDVISRYPDIGAR
jgi:hypothetical protein